MSKESLVSIIVPVYNYGHYLSDALNSLLNQSYDNWECLIIDDGSTDNTKDISNHYTSLDSRFQYIYQVNAGLSAARNTGIKASEGNYIQLLDADDMIEKDKIKLQAIFLDNNPQIDLIYSRMLSFDDINEIREFKPLLVHGKEQISGKGECLVNHLLDDNFFLPGSPLFKKGLYEDVGEFSTNLKSLEDWHFWYRAAFLNKEFYFDNRSGTALLVRNHSNSMSKNRYRMLANRISAREYFLALVNKELKKNNSIFSMQFLKYTWLKHNELLNKDKTKLHLSNGNFFTGVVSSLKLAYFSKNPILTLKDSAYLTKERVKRIFT